MDIIFTIGIFISLFQFLLLANKKSKSLPDRILAVWMLVIGIHLISYYLYYLGYWVTYPHLVGLTVPFPLFYGPLLFLYVQYSLKNDTEIAKIDYLHFLPIVLSYLYMIEFYFFYSPQQKRMVDAGEIDDYSIFSNILLIAFIISGISYSLLSYRLLNKYNQLLDHNFSNTEHINLNWLKGFIWGVGLIFLTVTIVLISRDLMGIEFMINPDYLFYSMIIIAILALGYFGIRHENIFVDNVVVELPPETKSSYKRSGLKEDQATDKYNHLLEVMRSQKPYLEPKLTLNNLATRLDISANHLSQIINQYEEQNFNDFVNKYRIEEFITKASKENHLSFLGLALESGFNSKSTFNAVFKKHKGETPSQYLSNHTNP